MLTAYTTQVQRLLQNPAAPTSLYTTTDINSYINTARGQLAGEAECIRYMGTISTVIGQQEYNFADMNLGTALTDGVEGVIAIRTIWYGIGTGRKWIPARPWEWFTLYNLNDAAPSNSFPTVWSQFKQGAAPGTSGSSGGGSFYISPAPDMIYTLYCDCVCWPIALADDTTVEAIPYLWTDAVPWYAAAYALWSSQTGARFDEAERYFNTYALFVERARKASNATPNRWQNSQAADPVQAQKLGLNRSR